MNRKIASVLCAAALAGGLLSGCAGNAAAAVASSQAAQATAEAASAVLVDDAVFASGAVQKQDLESGWDDAAATHIALNGDTVSVSGGGASWQDGVLTISEGGVYVLSGALADGQIVVAAPEADAVRLVLNGIYIAGSAGPALLCNTAARLTLTLVSETYNTITDLRAEAAADAEEEIPAAAVYSEASLVINGAGGLLVNGSHKNGVYTRDNLVLVSGDIEVNAPNNAMRGRDSVTLIEANLELTAGNDGLQSNNDSGTDKGWIELFGGSAAITAEHDGIQAESSLRAYGGTYTLLTGGGSANAPERAEESFGGGPGGMGAMTPPGDGSFPEGMQPPEGMELPDDRHPPEGVELPDAAQAQNGADTSEAPPENSAAASSEASQPDGSAAAADTADMTADTAADTAQESESDSAKGLKAIVSIEIAGGSFTIDSADDALHANGDIAITGGDFTLASGDDAVHADGTVLVDGEPHIDITACYEGLESRVVTVRGGDISVVATDDAINAAGGAEETEEWGPGAQGAGGAYAVNIEGGTLRLTGGTDGIDSNGELNISGGVTVLNMSRLLNGGDGILDRDGALTLTGGTIAGAGGNGFVTMGQQQTDTDQPAVAIYFSETQSAGTLVSLAAADGTLILSVAPTYDFSCVILSSPALAAGESYTLSTGGSAQEALTAGVYTGPVEGGEELLRLTLSEGIHSISDTGEAVTNTMGMGGGRGGFGPGGAA